MSDKSLTLSIVIPAYNEQDYLRACLDSIAAQTDMPDEVIVVDNNSTDNTVKIAKEYPFVRVIKEPKQHQSFAQKTGFNAAKGEILGRIDADSVLPADWAAKVKLSFARDPGLVAIYGTGAPYDVFSRRVAKAAFLVYNGLASKIAGHPMIWGANSAIRASTWRQIKDEVILSPKYWEDFDMAFLLAKHGKIRLIPDLETGISFRVIHKTFTAKLEYEFRAIRTFYRHKSLAQTGIFSAVWLTIFLLYPLLLADEYALKPLARASKKRTYTVSEAANILKDAYGQSNP